MSTQFSAMHCKKNLQPHLEKYFNVQYVVTDISGYSQFYAQLAVQATKAGNELLEFLPSYPTISMTHPPRNFFVLSLLFVFLHVCMAKSAGLVKFS